MSSALPAAAVAAAGVAGSLVAVVVERDASPDRVPTDALAIALTVTTYAGVGLLIAIVRPGHRLAALVLLGAMSWGVGEGLLALGLQGQVGDSASAWFATLGTTSRALGWLVLVLAVPFAFPDGRPPWRGRRAPTVAVVGAITLFCAATLVAPAPLDRRLEHLDSPTGLPRDLKAVADVIALLGLAACVVALIVAIAGLRHRWRSGDDRRHQQLLWLGLAFAIPVLFLPVIATDLAQRWMFAVVTLPVPIAVAVAILQGRLYDVQLAVSRTLTYVSLSAVIAALYALTVAGVGAVLDERGAQWLPWLAAGAVAVSFAPLRNALQQMVNRLTYGHWARPAEVLTVTSRRLADATDVPALFDSLVSDLGEGLRLSRVEIRGSDQRMLAAHGDGQGPLHDQLLTAYGTPVGTLRWGSERPLRTTDRQLLDDVASQLGGVVHSAALVDTLREAQHDLVVAREEERRRLRRDLHDGLGPTLASLTLRVDALRNTWATMPDPDAALLELRSAIQSAVSDVRRIVEGLRPAQLDELGLAGALEQLAVSATGEVDVQVAVRPLPPLPAAVEVAVFHVVQEAVSNARRHSGASRITVDVQAADGRVRAEVRDDGSGRVGPRPGGVGLGSMRERASVLGGSLSVTTDHGAVVRLELPLGGRALSGVAAS